MNTQTQTLTPQRRARADYLNLTLWTLQGWLTMFFAAAGYAKMTEPMDNLVSLLAWPARVSENLVRGVGLAEIILAVLILAPLVSWRIGRPLLLTASVGLAGLEAIMLVVHISGAQAGLAVINFLLLAITLPIIWFRFRPLL
ncbi:DoxX family protein [uncultured Brevundimonas sp.]|uniref:DoxX family protein n=1 Tax=uncultured Brevundimonas sp. TaxID=213418 RepID=UPI0030ECB275|tara:strand:- start:77428 stop:77853 length:426 start_codon:yes stop_codon:yes gene_type:complete